MTVALYTIHIIVALFLILVILLQQGKGSDLGAAFGGASSTVFGGASGRQSFLVKVTVGLGVVFVLLSLGLSWRASQIRKQGLAPAGTTQQLPSPALPSAPSGPAPSAPAPSAPVSPSPGGAEPGSKTPGPQ